MMHAASLASSHARSQRPPTLHQVLSTSFVAHSRYLFIIQSYLSSLAVLCAASRTYCR